MKDFFKSFGYAVSGVLAGIRSERNFRIQLGIGIATIGAGFYFKISSVEWCLILFSMGLVLGTELLNTAIEKLVDLVTQERMPLAKKIKDMAAGGTLVVSFFAFIIGVIIFGKHVMFVS